MAWAALLGTAYVVRAQLDASLGGSLAAIIGCYLALASMTFATFGADERGIVACVGMLVPAFAAAALAMLRPR